MEEKDRFRILGRVAAVWGVIGVVLFIGWAIYRLIPRAVAVLDYELSLLQIVFVVFWVGFMIVSEGYRGFQKAFAPRVVRRAVVLQEQKEPYLLILAPLMCMGYIHATRKRKIVSVSVTLAIVGLIVVVSQFAQPWRGLVDLGVVLGLVYGVGSILIFGLLAIAGRVPDIPADLPHHAELTK
ncbi:MAG: hypothetical protein ACFCU4_06665 [Puniceicoccaceae bacterium]